MISTGRTGAWAPNWTDISDGGLAITSQAVAGTAGTGVSGDIRTAESYASDQYSQVEVTSTQLTGGQWIGPMVRAQNSGQNAYVGIYFWNNGNPVLMLFKRSGRQLDPARQHLQQRAAGGRDPAEADGRSAPRSPSWLNGVTPAVVGHRSCQPDRRGAGHHGPIGTGQVTTGPAARWHTYNLPGIRRFTT